MAKAGTTGTGNGAKTDGNAKNAERRIAAKEAKKPTGADTMKQAIEKVELFTGSVTSDNQDGNRDEIMVKTATEDAVETEFEPEAEIGHSTIDAMTERLPELAENAKTTEKKTTEMATEGQMKDETEKIETVNDETAGRETAQEEIVEEETMREETVEKEVVKEEPVTDEQENRCRRLMKSYGIEWTVFADAWLEASCKGILADLDELDQAEYAGMLLAQTEYFWRHCCNNEVDYEISENGKSCMLIRSQNDDVLRKYEFTLEDVEMAFAVVNEVMDESPVLRERIRRELTGGSRNWRRECAVESPGVPFAVGSGYLYWYFALKDLRRRGYEVADELDEYGLLAVELPSTLKKWDREQPMLIPMTVPGLQILSSWCCLQEQKAEDEADEEVLVQFFMKLAGAFNDEADYGRVGKKFENRMVGEDGQFAVRMYDLSLDALQDFVDDVCGCTHAATILAAKALKFELAKLGWDWLNKQELLELQAELKKAETNKDGMRMVFDKRGTAQLKSERFNTLLRDLNARALDFSLADGILRAYGVNDPVELVMDIANELMR